MLLNSLDFTIVTLWLFNIAMGNGPFIDGLPAYLLKMVIFHSYVSLPEGKSPMSQQNESPCDMAHGKHGVGATSSRALCARHGWQFEWMTEDSVYGVY